MTKTIHFELVSPEAKLVSEPMYMAMIPSRDGEIGIGADHAPYVMALKPGVVKLVRKKGDAAERLFIAGGFADVNAGQCTVLAEQAIPVKDMDLDALITRRGELVQDVDMADTQIERDKFQAKIDLINHKINAIKFQ